MRLPWWTDGGGGSGHCRRSTKISWCTLLCLQSLCLLGTLVYQCNGQLRALSSQERLQYREKIRSMFYHAYDSYLKYASGFDELMPITCSGMNTWGTFSLSLIDALDTLAIMGNYSEFQRVASHIANVASFDTNTNVSVFETNIRVVGGLLAAHLLSQQAGVEVEQGWPCTGPLLRLAENVARKLLPAFDTATGMPYGTVNFLHGVPENETPVTCTAGVGTFIVEFGALSRLTGDPIFERTALKALDSLQQSRSKLGLLGNHINVQDGKWVATEAGIGAGVDSYFEYLVKGAMMLQLPSLIKVFHYDYDLIKQHLLKNDWYIWVSMTSGAATMPIFQSLEAFFPGVLTLMGELQQAKKSLYNYHQVWREYGFVPEFYDIANSKLHKRDGYPLRPEFIESVLYLYRATHDPHLLSIGADVVDSIDYSARTECGYATIKSVADHTIEDRMESFFLAETLKYLYLLFDEDNFMHNTGNRGTITHFKSLLDGEQRSCVIGTGDYVFNTEAHPIDIAALSCCARKKEDDLLLDTFFDRLIPLRTLNQDQLDTLISMPIGSDQNDEQFSLDDYYDESGQSTELIQQSLSSITSTSSASPTSRDNGHCDSITSIIQLIDNSETLESSFSTEPMTISVTRILDGKNEIKSELSNSLIDSPHSGDETNNQDQVNQFAPTIPLSSVNNDPTVIDPQMMITSSSDDFVLTNENSSITSSSSNNSIEQQFYYQELTKQQQQQKTLPNVATTTTVFNNLNELEMFIENELIESEITESEMTTNSIELLSCASQSFLSRLSLHGQMFD